LLFEVGVFLALSVRVGWAWAWAGFGWVAFVKVDCFLFVCVCACVCECVYGREGLLVRGATVRVIRERHDGSVFTYTFGNNG